MTEIRFSLVGPGRVGRSLAAWLVAAGGRLEQVAARDPREAAEVAGSLGGRAVPLDALDSSPQHLLLVTVADTAIAEVADRLAVRPQARVALHASGASGAAVLAPLRDAGSRLGTLHPLRAFPEPSADAMGGRDVVFTLDGDPQAVAMARRVVAAVGGVAVEIDPGSRTLYHLAASLAAGGVVTLLAVAEELAAGLELPGEVREGILALARQAVDQASRAPSPAAGLTGPVARGDAQLVARQIAALAAAAPDLVEVVTAVGRETLRQRRRHNATPGDAELARILGRPLRIPPDRGAP